MNLHIYALFGLQENAFPVWLMNFRKLIWIEYNTFPVWHIDFSMASKQPSIWADRFDFVEYIVYEPLTPPVLNTVFSCAILVIYFFAEEWRLARLTSGLFSRRPTGRACSYATGGVTMKPHNGVSIDLLLLPRYEDAL